jgi:hypothetical protein
MGSYQQKIVHLGSSMPIKGDQKSEKNEENQPDSQRRKKKKKPS